MNGVDPRRAALMAAAFTLVMGIALLTLVVQGTLPLQAPLAWIVALTLFIAPAVVGGVTYVRVQVHNALVGHFDRNHPGWRGPVALGMVVLLAVGVAVNVMMFNATQGAMEQGHCDVRPDTTGFERIWFDGPADSVDPTGILLPTSGDQTVLTPPRDTGPLWRVNFTVQSTVVIDLVTAMAQASDGQWYAVGAVDRPGSGTYTLPLDGFAEHENLRWEVRLVEPAEQRLSVDLTWSSWTCQTE